MAKPIYKNRMRKGFGLDPSITKTLEAYSNDSFIPESRIVDMALKEFFEKHKIEILQ